MDDYIVVTVNKDHDEHTYFLYSVGALSGEDAESNLRSMGVIPSNEITVAALRRDETYYIGYFETD